MEIPEATNFIQEIIVDDLKTGKRDKVHTRFPPEPNGYLHIGHAKSFCISFGVKEKYNENIGQLAYNLGKWVYLIDALDDYDKDRQKSNFNVFVNAYPDIESKQELIKEKGGDIVFVFSNIFDQIDNLSKTMNYKFNHDLIDNILLRGLKTQTKQIMECKKCKTTIKY